MARHLNIILGFHLVLIGFGCSSTEKEVAKVKGRVIFHGKGVPAAEVTFYPIGSPENPEPGKMAYGETDSEGFYQLSTYAEGDGAVVGMNRVVVEYSDPFKTLPGEFVGPKEVEVKSDDSQNELDFVLE